MTSQIESTSPGPAGATLLTGNEPGRPPAGVPAPAPSGTFRLDIQGLRGVAVLLVVCYHAGLAFSGGFIGVDVFFVVSGFVIAVALQRELQATGTIRLLRFYTRRARRLLPAFAVASALTLAGSALVLDAAGEQQRAVLTAVAASLFLANHVLYAANGDYFGPEEESNPFLHTWSLSVEEQFYLVFPTLLLLLWRWQHRRQERRGRGGASAGPAAGRRARHRSGRFMLAAIAGVGAVSLAASWLLVDTSTGLGFEFPKLLAFYAMPTRMWEFAAGILLALAGPRVPWKRLAPAGPTLRAAATVVAVACGTGLLVAAAVYDRSTGFPGLAAMLPVAATAGLIAAGPSSDAAYRVLSWRPLTGIGDVSYGWYLLHWPAIVFARKLWPGSDVALVAAITASLVAALLLYRFVENPIRRNHSITGWRAAGMAVVAIGVPVLVAAGLSAALMAGLGPQPPAGRDDSALPAAIEHGCIIESLTTTGSQWDPSSCLFNTAAGGGTVLLLGDSHASAVSDAVIEAGRRLDRPVAVWARATCPFVGRAAPGYDACHSWQADALDLMAELEPSVVVIANRSPAYVLPTTGAESPLGPISLVDGTPATDRSGALDSWQTGLAETIDAVTSQGVAVLVITTVPEYPPGSFANPTVVRPDPEPPTITLDAVADRRGEVIERERRVIEQFPAASAFDPVPYLCATSCTAADGDVWIYSDNHHVNRYGSERLAPGLAAALGELTGQMP